MHHTLPGMKEENYSTMWNAGTTLGWTKTSCRKEGVVQKVVQTCPLTFGGVLPMHFTPTIHKWPLNLDQAISVFLIISKSRYEVTVAAVLQSRCFPSPKTTCVHSVHSCGCTAYRQIYGCMETPFTYTHMDKRRHSLFPGILLFRESGPGSFNWDLKMSEDIPSPWFGMRHQRF